MARLKTAYPDDLLQNRKDRRRPPAAQAHARPRVRDHAHHHQGGGTTGEVGGARPAENFDSGLSPIDGRDVIPGDDALNRGERHWDAPLASIVPVVGVEGLQLRTLRDAGDFLSGRYATLDHSAALQETALAMVRAARLGTPEAVAQATSLLRAYLRLMAML